MYIPIIVNVLQYILGLIMLSLSTAAALGVRWLGAPKQLLPTAVLGRVASAVLFFLTGLVILAGAWVPFLAFFSAIPGLVAAIFLAVRSAPLKSPWLRLMVAAASVSSVLIALGQPLGLKVLLLPKADELPIALAPFHVVKTYDEGMWFEGIAARADGTLYLSGNRGLDFSRTDYYRSAHGELIERSPEGNEKKLFETPEGSTAGVLALSSDGTIYMTSHGQSPCIWRIAPSGAGDKISQLPTGAWPNGIDIGPDGQIYVADSALGLVWRVDPINKKSDSVIEDKQLSARPFVSLAPGINGLHFNKNELYVTVSDRTTVLRYRMDDSGKFSSPEVIARGIPGDDFAIGPDGSLYITTHPYNTLVRVSPDGTRSIIAGASEHMLGATDAVFGKSAGSDQTLYVVTDGGAFTGGPHMRGELVAIQPNQAAEQSRHQ